MSTQAMAVAEEKAIYHRPLPDILAYLQNESTMDFTKLRTPEADKVNCGKRHFEAIGVPFSVVVTAHQV